MNQQAYVVFNYSNIPIIFSSFIISVDYMEATWSQFIIFVCEM